MYKKRIFLGALPFFILGCFFCFVYFFSESYTNKLMHIKAVKGSIVIPETSEPRLFSISGEFHFTPSQFYSLTDSSKKSYGNIPGTFMDTKLKSIFGYGSYGLYISGLKPNAIYTLHVGQASSSCNIVINSKDSLQQGQPGISRDMEIPGIMTSQAPFRARPDGTADVILNISNFRNKRGGFYTPLVLGEAEQIKTMFRSDLILNSGIFACIFTIAVFFFVLPFFYKQSSFIWWFAFASVIAAIRSSFFYPNVASFLFPSLSWHIHFIFKHITVPLLILFFVIFMKKTLNVYFKIPYIIIVTVTVCTVGLMILLPPQTVSNVNFAYQFFILGCIIYSVLISIISLIKKREMSLWIFTSISVLIIFGVHDLLVNFGIIFGNLYVHIGSLVSVMILSVMILNQYSNSIIKLEKLNKEIKIINKSLTRFFPEKIIKLLNKNSITDVKLGDSAELQMPILSIDIRSFTLISENLAADQVFKLLNEYFALVVPIIRNCGGIITKYLGDGFFALFPDGADAAVSCAIEIQNQIKEHKIIPPNCEPIKIGIGIDFDNLLLGTIGDNSRMDSIIISNAYYVSEILQQQTKKYRTSIIISDRTFANLENPNAYYIRPVQKIKNDFEKQSFLFEVYDSDDSLLKELKYKTQDYIEQGLHAVFNQKDAAHASLFFEKALNIYPEDAIAIRYKKLLKKYKDHL